MNLNANLHDIFSFQQPNINVVCVQRVVGYNLKSKDQRS